MKQKQPEKELFQTPYEGREFTRAVRRKIDDDIGRLERRIQSLKAKRNEISLISALPPEVLSEIFTITRDSFDDFEFRNHSAKWMCIGQVCHHWREVALSCPSLWSVPVFTKPDLAQEMMQRSKMAPLTIRHRASSWAPKMHKQLENALAQLYRIQFIDLTLGPSELNTILPSLSQPAPLLEILSLSGPDSPTTQFTFPLDALSDAPRLRGIDFNHLNFSWESALFKHGTLTDLRLRDNYTTRSSSASTIGQMMGALYHLPYLRTLNLTDSIPSHTTSNGYEKILEFKFLEKLTLDAKAVDCIFFLHHIQYPPHATVVLYSSSTEVEDSTTIFSLLGQNLRRTQSIKAGIHHSPVVIRSAELDSPKMDAVEIAFYNFESVYVPIDGLPFIQICLDGGCALIQARAQLLADIQNGFDLSSVTGIYLDCSFTDDHIYAIQNFFGKLPKLKIIHVCQSFLEICIAIAGDEGPEEVQPQHSFPFIAFFSALRTLKVHDQDFWKHQHVGIVEHLIDMLIKRSNDNAPIDKLIIEYCSGAYVWQIKRLGEVVVDLEVHGDEIDVTDLNSSDWKDEDYYF